MISDIWDYVVDGFDYIIHFEWAIDLKDGIVDTFSNLGELSYLGIGFGVFGVLFLLFTKQWMLDAFLNTMKPSGKIIWGGLTFLVTFIVCYLLGSHFENS